MRVTDEFLAKIDDWRRQQPSIPSRAEAIRLLVDEGLKRARPGTMPVLRAKEAKS